MGGADLLLVNADVRTMDGARPRARAVAVKDGLIVHVGDGPGGWAGPRTEVIDLAGRTLLPGINDAHAHACGHAAGRPPYVMSLVYPEVRSIADVLARVAEAVRRTPEGEWIRGTGWDAGYLEEGRLPHRADLDAVAPYHPVLLQDFSGHRTWANSLAFELAGIDGPVTDGVVVDGAGLPTGLLDNAARELLQRAVPLPTFAERRELVRAAVAIMHREGVTSFTEPGLGPGGERLFFGALGEATLDAYASLAREGELRARVSVLALPSGMSGASVPDLKGYLSARDPLEDVDPRLLNVLGVKIFADGIPPARTAWMHEEYPEGGHGGLCVRGASDAARGEELAEMVRLAHQAGLQVGVHVVGDRGIDEVVRALAAAVAGDPRPDARHYVIHGQYVSPAALARLAALGFGLNIQPRLQSLVAEQTRELFGDELTEREWPAASALAAGVNVTSSSDCPVTPPDWRAGLAALLTRRAEASGRVAGEAERLTLDQALRTYTVNGAWQDFAESWKGSLTPGKVADLCVVDAALGEVPPAEVAAVPVAMTVFGGQVVHTRLSG